MIEKSIRVSTHGRYLASQPDAPSPILMGFHGYAESAEMEFQRLKSVEGSERWLIVAVQGLHRFYRRRTNEIVASWMTRQDRDSAIADNIAYTSAVLEEVALETQTQPGIVLSGFSQGVAMAYRCAVNVERPVRGVVALAGDVPPELDAAALRKIPAALLGCGDQDEWYTAAKLESDEKRLRAAGVNVRVLQFHGGHEWNDEFRRSTSEFLKSCL